MNWRRVPVLSTLVVLAAVAVMVRLGFWQLDRLHEKETLIAMSEQAFASSESVDLNRAQLIDYPTPYSHVRVQCTSLGPTSASAGRNASGQSGWAHRSECIYRSGGGRDAATIVVTGWSTQFGSLRPAPGTVFGTIVPEKASEPWHWHIVADPPLAGLQANARPDPRDMPNNHLAYAVQWFLFALTALVIYAIALRRRLRAS